jgi:hypothetical protein
VDNHEKRRDHLIGRNDATPPSDIEIDSVTRSPARIGPEHPNVSTPHLHSKVAFDRQMIGMLSGLFRWQWPLVLD